MLNGSTPVPNGNGHVLDGDGPIENGHVMRRNPLQSMNVPLSWLELRVFYVRISKCEISDSIPESLTLNHIPLTRDTLLEVNGVRNGIYSDGVSTLLRRDRCDKRSEEIIFVSTDNVRMTNSVKFEVFDKDFLMLSGQLELCNTNGCIQESRSCPEKWILSCETEAIVGSGIFKGRPFTGPESGSPTVEVYVAGAFSGMPIILTKTLHVGFRKKHSWNGTLGTIPEYESADSPREYGSSLSMQMEEYQNKTEGREEFGNLYSGAEYIEGEDGELTWFNAGVRVGVGIGLSVCLGIGLGVGILVRTYQGTARTFRRRLL
ncbi:hypothetical protein MLD38_027026 [Melastoma candidum]|uniref:Uncharacterized protein n=1 Tax=Melastoma candidum TaxID=119954 RepID=A0ACB9P087_9MYRT|nr:hypothetical protein MLD38_027026 [Melastoma candidum]